MERYIFLDIDGVLNTERNYKALVQDGQRWRDDYGPYFDPESVANLHSIIKATQADIIITSTWKYNGLDAIHTLWTLREMRGILLGITPEAEHADYCTRGMEIKKWLASNAPEDPADYRYIIIDDSPYFLPEQMDLLIRTNSKVGITADDAARAIALLMQTENS